MTILRILRRLAYWRRFGANRAELEEELAYHRELVERDLIARGHSATESRDAARRAIGNETLMREDARAVWLWPSLDAIWPDAKGTLRGLRRSPAFTTVATLTLALAIGANTAIFSVIDTVLLDPLSFPEPDELVVVKGTAPGAERPDARWATRLEEEFGLGAEFYLTYKDNARAFESLAFAKTTHTIVRSGEHVEQLFIAEGPPSLFSTLRVRPVIGRLPTMSDEKGRVVLLSHRVWTDWFGRNSDIVGQTIHVGGEFRTIVGVLPASFEFPSEETALWLHDLITPPLRPGAFDLLLVGRLAPNATHQALATELATLTPRVLELAGGAATYAHILERYRPIVRSLEDELVGDLAKPLWVLLGTMGIVLLVACANIANLLIVRAEARERELSIRLALGAGRGRLIHLLLSEALILATIGGTTGTVLAWAGVPLLVRAAPESIPRIGDVAIDGGALLFTAVVVTVAALTAGVLPAFKFSKPDVATALRSSHGTGAAGSRVTQNVLVVVQTAAAVVLLIGSGLLFQSFLKLRSVNPGYDTENILTFQITQDSRRLGLTDGAALARFHYMFMDRLARLPGAESVGLVSTLPLDEGATDARVETAHYKGPPQNAPRVHLTFADGDYFRTMGISFLAGQTFERRAEPGREVTAIVSRAAAGYLWPGQNPIGQVIRLAGAGEGFPWLTVGGVVEDVMLADFRQQSPEPLIYLPIVGPAARPWGVGTPAYVIRSPREDLLVPEIRSLIKEVAPGAPMYRIFTMEVLAKRSMARLTFTMLALFIAAALALVLGAVGIYGTISYVVSRRTREIGIRMALGARAADVRTMVITQGARVALVGVIMGVVIALFSATWLESLLFDIHARDPIVFGAVSVVVLGVALLACYLPARRASGVDPVKAMRVE